MLNVNHHSTIARGTHYLNGQAPELGPGPVILRMLKKETGHGLEAWKHVKKSHPNNSLEQIQHFFDNFHIPAATGRKRTASYKTDLAYRVRLTTVVKKLSEMNMPVRNLDEMGAKQVKLMFKQFEKEGWSSSWMANLNTVVRRFGIWIGKPDLCPRLPLLLDNPWSAQRRYAATEPRTWESKNIDQEMYFSKIGLENPVTALQLRLAKAFGVRVQEFLMFRPAAAIRGANLYVKDGTKGGRPRLVPIETEEQRDLLKQALELSEQHPLGLMVAKRGINLKKATNHFYNTVTKLGISRKALGVTAHGLRHGYACKVFKELTGEDAPVLGGKSVDPELEKKARLEIAERLGHSRADVVSAYIGSHRTFSRIKKDNIETLIRVLEGDAKLKEMAGETGFSQLCVLSDAANGDPIKKGGALLIGYEALKKEGQSQEESDNMAMEVASKMAARAGALFDVVGSAVAMRLVSIETATLALLRLQTNPRPAAHQ